MSKPELPQNFEQWCEAYNPVPQAGSVAAFGYELRDAYESGYDYGYRKALEDAAKVCDERAGEANREEQLRSLERTRSTVEILHRGIGFGARECASAIRALVGDEK